jgi:hypothetical protein
VQTRWQERERIRCRRGNLLQRNVEFHLSVSDVPEHDGEDVALGEGRLAVTIECGRTGYDSRPIIQLRQPCNRGGRCGPLNYLAHTGHANSMVGTAVSAWVMNFRRGEFRTA